jgi:Protein of unknown function (DUF1232)
MSSSLALASKTRWRPGVAGLHDPKWIIVALCYIAAVALMGQDPWFGEKQFTYNQGIFVGILALLIVAGFCWESYLLGRPAGINLILHCLLIVPATLFIGRVVGLPAAARVSEGWLGKIKDFALGLKDAAGFADILPDWLEDMFRNPGVVVLIIFVSLAFTQQRSSRRFALILIGLLIPTLRTISHEPKPTLLFGVGCLALGIGLALQFSRYGEVLAQQNVLARLHPVDDPLELRCSLRITRRVLEDGYLAEDGVLAVVHREYGKHYDLEPPAVRGIAQTISHRLVREHRVLELHGDERGFFLIPYEGIHKIDSLFGEIAVLMRKIILTAIVLIWLISPIDIFPDSLPILGTLDDALMALIGASQWLDTFRRRRYELPKP